MTVPPLVWAQQSPPNSAPPPSPNPFSIIDNSFLVEEAFNQDPGTFQNIFGAARAGGGGWGAVFTQEWPLLSQSHQISYTLPWTFGGDDGSFGNTLLNYRFQALREGPGTPAFAPRISAVLPTATVTVNDTGWGLQVNLPFSKRTGYVYWHWNAGVTWFPSAPVGNESVSLEVPFLAGSAIYRLAPFFHVMLEVVGTFDERRRVVGTERSESLTASPGVRGGFDIGERQQIVFGFAVPTTWSSRERREIEALIYASYELPFRK